MPIQTSYGYTRNHGYAGDLLFEDHEGESVRNRETTALGFGLFVYKSAFIPNSEMSGLNIRCNVLLPNATTIDPNLLLVTKRCNLWGVEPSVSGYNSINQVNDAYTYGYPPDYAVEGISEGVIYVQVHSEVVDTAVFAPSTQFYVETLAGVNRGKVTTVAGASKILLPLSLVRAAQAGVNTTYGQRHTALRINFN